MLKAWRRSRIFRSRISGASFGNRPGVLAMQKAAFAGELDAIIVADLTRLSRNSADLPKFLERMRFRKIRVIGGLDRLTRTCAYRECRRDCPASCRTNTARLSASGCTWRSIHSPRILSRRALKRLATPASRSHPRTGKARARDLPEDRRRRHPQSGRIRFQRPRDPLTRRDLEARFAQE